MSKLSNWFPLDPRTPRRAQLVQAMRLRQCCGCRAFFPYQGSQPLTLRPPQGPRALYKGFVPKALRLGIGQTIGLMVFQESMALMGAKDGQ